MSESSSATPRETLPVSTTSTTTGGNASASRCASARSSRPAVSIARIYSGLMAVVIASNIRKEIAGNVLFDGVSFSVERRDRVALSGPNGAGKTTLLRILAGETEKHGGELAFQKGTRVALHDQRPPLEQAMSLREYVLSGARDLVATEEELARLEQAMAGGAHDQATLNRYSEAQARLEHAGGYGWRDHAASVLRGLGFAEEDLDRPLRTFSGGELTRASLARALGGDPDLLLLDEPTNHLDVANLEWLERELNSLDAAVILVAHDRWFLEAVTTATLEVEAGRGTFFPGPWHAWRREKAARMLHAQKEVARVQNDIVRLERFVERFRAKKNKAMQAQAKITQIGRLAGGEGGPLRAGRAALAQDARARVRVPQAGAQRPHRRRGERRSRSRSADARPPPRRDVRDRARRARCARRAERLRQDDAARTAREGGGRLARLRRPGRLLLAAGDGARRARLGAPVRPVDDRAAAARRAEPARALPLLRLGRAREAGRGACREASGGGSRSR